MLDMKKILAIGSWLPLDDLGNQVSEDRHTIIGQSIDR